MHPALHISNRREIRLSFHLTPDASFLVPRFIQNELVSVHLDAVQRVFSFYCHGESVGFQDLQKYVPFCRKCRSFDALRW